MYGLGSGLFPEAFDQELRGHEEGPDEVSSSIDVPAESSTLLDAVWPGKTVEGRLRRGGEGRQDQGVLPEVTDEWAKDTLGFENVEDLRARVAESIAQQKADVLPRMKENACLAVLSERLEGEVPQAMAEDSETSLLQDFFQQLQRQNMSFDTYLMQQGITSDRFKEDVKQQALDMAKQDLALDAWARHFELLGHRRRRGRRVREERRRRPQGASGRMAQERPAPSAARGHHALERHATTSWTRPR